MKDLNRRLLDRLLYLPLQLGFVCVKGRSKVCDRLKEEERVLSCSVLLSSLQRWLCKT